MYKSFLTWELSIEKLVLFVKDDKNWVQAVSHNLDEKHALEQLPPLFLKYTRLHTTKKSDPLILQEFEFIIPVYHKSIPIAYSLVSGINKGNDVYNNIQLITSITNIVAVAIENKRLVRQQIIQEKEWELAREVTSMLIPDKMPQGSKFALANVYRPHYKVGGDYIDYLWFSETQLCFCIADVSGKGIAAAMIMANFQALVQNLAQQYKDLETLVMVLNRAVLRITKGEKYLTFFIAVADLEKAKLYYVNAGHIPPVLYRKGSITDLKATTTIIGHFEDLPDNHEGELDLTPGSLLLAFTDGLTDVKNRGGHQFSSEMIRDFVAAHHADPPQAICHDIMDEVLDFGKKTELPDDIAIMSFKFMGE